MCQCQARFNTFPCLFSGVGCNLIDLGCNKKGGKKAGLDSFTIKSWKCDFDGFLAGFYCFFIGPFYDQNLGNAKKNKVTVRSQ
jgi:hypothetical protein